MDVERYKNNIWVLHNFECKSKQLHELKWVVTSMGMMFYDFWIEYSPLIFLAYDSVTLDRTFDDIYNTEMIKRKSVHSTNFHSV